MTIGEAVFKNILKVGSILEHNQNRKLLKVKRIVPNDSYNSGVLCNYLDKQEQEDMIKRGYTCVKLMCYDDYIPYREKVLAKG